MIHKRSYKKSHSYKKSKNATRHQKKKYFGGTIISPLYSSYTFPDENENPPIQPELANILVPAIKYKDDYYTFEGSGSFGNVYINTVKNEAIKIIDTSSRNVNMRLKNEIYNYHSISKLPCNSNYFCKFKEYFYDKSKHKIYVLMEYCGRNLHFILNYYMVQLQSPPPLPLSLVLGWFLNIANGIKCMHDNGYVHLDIKPANITIYDTPDQVLTNSKSKLIDFGLAKNVSELATLGTIYSAGTPGYAAPELTIKHTQQVGTRNYFSSRVSMSSIQIDYKKCDIYSFGRTLQQSLSVCRLSLSDRQPLVILDPLIYTEPSYRPNIDGVIDLITRILGQLSS